MLTELFIDLALAERKAAIGRNKFATLAEIGQRIGRSFRRHRP
jgi:hypothetical protein